MRGEESEIDYFSRRAAVEAAAADCAGGQVAAAIHRELAALYGKRAADCGRSKH